MGEDGLAPKDALSATPLFRIATGFFASKVLSSAVELEPRSPRSKSCRSRPEAVIYSWTESEALLSEAGFGRSGAVARPRSGE